MQQIMVEKALLLLPRWTLSQLFRGS